MDKLRYGPDWIEQDDLTATITETTISVSQSYHCFLEDLQRHLTRIKPGVRGVIKDWETLPVESVNARDLGDGGRAEINVVCTRALTVDDSSGGGGGGSDWEFPGKDDPQPEPEPETVIGVKNSTSNEPLTSQPRYIDNLNEDDWRAVSLFQSGMMKRRDDGKWAVNWETDKVGIYTPSNSYAEMLLNFLEQGIDNYKACRPIVSISYVSPVGPSSNILNAVGKISNPGKAPAPAAGRNYLMTGLDITFKGGLYTYSESHELSGHGGWNEDIYE